jgi:hypothetical protein
VLDGAHPKCKVIMVAYKDKRLLLREAETLRFRKFKRPYNQKNFDKEKKLKLDYLDPNIVKHEEKAFFHVNEMELYEGGSFETILSESEINL